MKCLGAVWQTYGGLGDYGRFSSGTSQLLEICAFWVGSIKFIVIFENVL